MSFSLTLSEKAIRFFHLRFQMIVLIIEPNLLIRRHNRFFRLKNDVGHTF